MFIKRLKTPFNDSRAFTIVSRYTANNSLSISLGDPDENEPICDVTVCVPTFELLPGHVLVKTWSENAGVLEALIKEGIFEDTGTRVPTRGFGTEAALCKLLVSEADLKTDLTNLPPKEGAEA